jgi:AAA+ ATPase superfamily predicted ATPase
MGVPERLIGRKRERLVLDLAMESPEAELVAVYGRRRVGKTFLIRQHFGTAIELEVTGSHATPMKIQLARFADALAEMVGGVRPEVPESWVEAFRTLARMIEQLPPPKTKRVVFIDEMPWLSTRRSGFLPAFEHFWNAWASKRTDLVVVVCGSAASWMVRELLYARGGLHNRVTRRIRLEPFNLAEVRRFLESRRVMLDDYQILELYMAFGGIPHYLKEVRRGESAAQCIDRTCFSKSGPFHDEFQNVFASLFEESERHALVVRSLAERRSGLSRNELLDRTKLRSGGWVTNVLAELEASGFVIHLSQFGRAKKDVVYRLADEHTLFHLTWIEKHRGRSEGAWARIRGSPAWRAWSGYEFESVCVKHVDCIRRALGIWGVQTEESTWRYRATNDDEGAQIDLVIDRKDACVNLCEMKYTEAEFVIDRAYARELANKRETFRRITKTRKALFTTLVTVHGIAVGKHRDSIVDVSIDASSLFADP